ncbi:alpha/beta hydrolase [Flavobacterium sp. 140616W15]|uniref:alpha/beta hydrolase n=1 Tax=Flavobacterium sp. 140616W15 TaxID=2478552 RepID=UPI000F0BFCF9|nr:alpha/beta hydrolase-fold protein [Flavobacterium sp. 140616W15]AYN05077.1 alpha/beta hydrolase [Flavobacterium sp. 140616W15]
MKKIFYIFIFLLYSNLNFAQTKSKQTPNENQPIVLGITDKLKSTELGETRTINIYLPQGYNKKDTLKYPVIYILDGGVEEDFIHITGIVRFNTEEWIARFPKSIVVGIENTNRRRDFTFSVPNLDFVEKMGFKKQNFPQYGGSEKYIAFLEKELQPYIDKKFNTSNHKTVIGESLAGLLATEILLKHRNLFDNYIIIAPSLWWGDQSLLTEAPKLLKAKENKPALVYIAACDKDEDKTMYDVAMSLSETLKQNDEKNTKVYYDYIQNEIHSTVMHQAVYNGFKAFYPKSIYQK